MPLKNIDIFLTAVDIAYKKKAEFLPRCEG